MMLSDIQRFLSECAILAPSADNRHPFRFEDDKGALLLRGIGPAIPRQGGYKRILHLLSLGAVAENIVLAASRYQLQATIDLAPDAERPDLLMRVNLSEGLVEPDPLVYEIPKRHTNRKVWFKGPPPSEMERRELESSTLAYPEVRLDWLDRPRPRKAALALMRKAETERFHNPLLHQELFSAIRFELGWRATCPEGLPPGALGVEPPLRPFFSLLRHWSVMRLANLVGAHHILGWRACGLPCGLAPSLCLLAVKNTDTQTVLGAGRAFQRLWLAATRQGSVIQPMPASALYALPGACEEGIPAELREKLAAGWLEIMPGEVPLMLFRMGHAEQATVTSGRRALAEYWNTSC